MAIRMYYLSIYFAQKDCTSPPSGPMTQKKAEKVTNRNKLKLLYIGGNVKHFFAIPKHSQMQFPKHSAWFVPLCHCILEHLGAQEDQHFLVHPERSTELTQALFLHIHTALQKH